MSVPLFDVASAEARGVDPRGAAAALPGDARARLLCAARARLQVLEQQAARSPDALSGALCRERLLALKATLAESQRAVGLRGSAYLRLCREARDAGDRLRSAEEGLRRSEREARAALYAALTDLIACDPELAALRSLLFEMPLDPRLPTRLGALRALLSLRHDGVPRLQALPRPFGREARSGGPPPAAPPRSRE